MKKIILGIIIIVLLVPLFNIMHKMSAEDEKAIQNCINNGKNENYCKRIVYGS